MCSIYTHDLLEGIQTEKNDDNQMITILNDLYWLTDYPTKEFTVKVFVRQGFNFMYFFKMVVYFT